MFYVKYSAPSLGKMVFQNVLINREIAFSSQKSFFIFKVIPSGSRFSKSLEKIVFSDFWN